jgi:Zn-dependent protease with chaperone function
LAVLLVPFLLTSRVATAEVERNERNEVAARNLQRVLDNVRERLGIDRAVTVTVVASNPHHVSVEPPAAIGAAFVVQVEEAILELLTEDEVEATIAHELGHVWVFTHHPYLQTELLANQVAMRAVSRDALVRVYEKVWGQTGHKGDMTHFLGRPGARPVTARPGQQ